MRADDHLAGGVAPALGEPLGIEFANTRFMVRGVVQDGLVDAGSLTAWLQFHADECGTVGALTRHDLERFVSLRNCIRDIAAALVDQRTPPRTTVGVLNRAAAAAPRWPQVRAAGAELAAGEQTSAGPVDAALATIARSAISVFTGPQRADLRACPAPTCVLYFVRDHPRRQWCSAGCGNRTRVSRFHRRHQDNH